MHVLSLGFRDQTSDRVNRLARKYETNCCRSQFCHRRKRITWMLSVLAIFPTLVLPLKSPLTISRTTTTLIPLATTPQSPATTPSAPATYKRRKRLLRHLCTRSTQKNQPSVAPLGEERSVKEIPPEWSQQPERAPRALQLPQRLSPIHAIYSAPEGVKTPQDTKFIVWLRQSLPTGLSSCVGSGPIPAYTQKSA